MNIKRYKPQAKVTFYTEKGELVARATNDPGIGGFSDDVIRIRTQRDIGADSPTFYIELVRRKPWHLWVAPNDLVIIEMHRPPEAISRVMVGLVEDVRKRVVITQEGKPQRAITISGRGAAKAFIQYEIGLVPEVQYVDRSIGWLIGGGSIKALAGHSGDIIAQEMWDNFARTYLNYTFSNNKSLFDIIKSDFTFRQGVTLMTDIGLINWQGSLWAFFKEISDPPFNELFWELDKDGNPTLYMRPTPFNEERWRLLDSVIVTDDDIVAEELGRSDLETYTLFSVGMKPYFSKEDLFKTTGIYPLWYKPYADKYGIRRLHIESLYASYGEGGDISTVEGVLKSLREDLYNWNVKNNGMFNGIFVVKGSSNYKVATRLIHKSTEEGTELEYYIRSVAHEFVNFGNWTSQVAVIRGMKNSDRFAPPWGKGTDYSGMAWAPYNPDEALQQFSGNDNPVDETYANAIVQGAYEVMNQGNVKYVFGANDASHWKFDCSSFVQYIFSRYGNMQIGRTTHEQIKKGTAVDKNHLLPGDLVFFQNTYNASPPTHVGICVGNGEFIHCSSSPNLTGKGDVRNNKLSDDYYTQHWYAAKRVLTPNNYGTSTQVFNGGRMAHMVATAYGGSVRNGGLGTWKTASGTVPMEGRTVAVDKTVIPLGTKLKIECPSYPSVNGIYVAEDTGGAIKQSRIDIYFDDSKDVDGARRRMLDFGKRDITVTIL